jgi:hypothetical protein
LQCLSLGRQIKDSKKLAVVMLRFVSMPGEHLNAVKTTVPTLHRKRARHGIPTAESVLQASQLPAYYLSPAARGLHALRWPKSTLLLLLLQLRLINLVTAAAGKHTAHKT